MPYNNNIFNNPIKLDVSCICHGILLNYNHLSLDIEYVSAVIKFTVNRLFWSR